MADYTGAIEMLVPDAFVFPDAWGNTRKFLVLHKTAGGSTAQGIAQWFQSGAAGAHTSVHYAVGLDGAIVQVVREKDGAGGNCCLEAGHDAFWPTDINLNLITFSIENVDSSLDNSNPMPQTQKDALFPLVKDICTRHNIPMRPADAQGGIAGHNSIAAQSRAHCPGNFAWDELWTYLKEKGGNTMQGIPPKWTDDGTTLTAPNGHRVVRGFRDFILKYGQWPADNWPLEEEHAQSPLEFGNIHLGSGTQQMFRWTCLEWTPQNGVFVMWIGQELLALRAKLAQKP